jgi:hypothetical protein
MTEMQTGTRNEMTKKVVIGVYNGLARAEDAELRLEEAHLPVGQMSLFAQNPEEEQSDRTVMQHDITSIVAGTGVQLARDQIAGYQQVLRNGKILLVFRGDAEEVAQAYEALGRSENEDLSVMGA